MPDALPSLAGAAWLASPAVRAIFSAIDQDGEETRVVGGAVRNALMDLPVGEIDFATTATPDIVSARGKAAGMKVVPTGVEHGTVTLICHGQPFEVTTLREDVETDGRRAVVRFGRDWVADALRRDFTINALSVDAAGKVFDPVEGYADILARRIRFIGDPDRRIAEDRLRVLRLFRFHAQYGEAEFDRAGLAAATRARNDIRALSAERIGQEMRRLVVAPGAADSLTIMQDSGILGVVLAGVAYLGPFAMLARTERALGLVPHPALRLAALGARIAEDVDRLTERLRLSNAERDRMSQAIASRGRLEPLPDETGARVLLYRLGAQTWRDAVLLSAAWNRAPVEDGRLRDLVLLPERWPVPVFPLSGSDVLREGGERGPAVGALLKAVESWWVENDFRADATLLRQRLQQMMASAQ
jgi:tRNA nucleotidyltransferase/poly(A) polymerase